MVARPISGRENGGHGIAGGDEHLALAGAIRKAAGPQLDEAGRGVGHPFDHAQGLLPGPEHADQERRDEREDHLAGDVVDAGWPGPAVARWPADERQRPRPPQLIRSRGADWRRLTWTKVQINQRPVDMTPPLYWPPRWAGRLARYFFRHTSSAQPLPALPVNSLGRFLLSSSMHWIILPASNL